MINDQNMQISLKFTTAARRVARVAAVHHTLSVIFDCIVSFIATPLTAYRGFTRSRFSWT